MGLIRGSHGGGGGRRPRVAPSRLVAPLRERSFRRLVAGKGISYFGDWLMVAALVAWVYEGSGSIAKVAALMVVRLVPPIVGGGLAAAIADRVPKQRLLVASELAAALTVAGALTGVLTGSDALVFASVALCGLASMVGTVAMNALVPALVDRERLAGANAVLCISQEAAMAAGALAGGLAITQADAAVALAVNLASYAIALALFCGISPRTAAEADGSPAQKRGLVAGVRYLRRRPRLLALAAGFALATLATGLTNATLPRLLDDVGLGPGAYGFGLAVLALGLLLGEAAIGIAAERIQARWLAFSLAGMAAGFLLLGFSTTATAALLALGVAGFVNGTAEVILVTGVQQEADPEYRGRVFALASTAMRTTMLGAVAAAPLVNAVASPHAAVIGAAAVLAAGSLVVFAGTRREPAPAQLAHPSFT